MHFNIEWIVFTKILTFTRHFDKPQIFNIWVFCSSLLVSMVNIGALDLRLFLFSIQNIYLFMYNICKKVHKLYVHYNVLEHSCVLCSYLILIYKILFVVSVSLNKYKYVLATFKIFRLSWYQLIIWCNWGLGRRKQFLR